MDKLVRASSVLAILLAGCWSRTLGTSPPPETLASFSFEAKHDVIDKVDLLCAIDDSASMADKQSVLAA